MTHVVVRKVSGKNRVTPGFLWLGWILLAAGCLPDAGTDRLSAADRFERSFIGSWMILDDSSTVHVSKAEVGRYHIFHAEDGITTRYHAEQQNVLGTAVLEFWPLILDSPDGVSGSSDPKPGHSIARIEFFGEGLLLSLMKPAFLSATDIKVVTVETLLGRPDAWESPEVWQSIPRGKDVSVDDPACMEQSYWPEADRLFRGDSHWLGADGASTVDLGNARVLWLFADSWISGQGSGSRENATMVSNSLAIQHGYSPDTASMDFFWGKDHDGTPAAFFPDENGVRHWFGNGVLVEDRLVLFADKIVSVETGLGFEAVGWTAWIIDNPEEDPELWKPQKVGAPENDEVILLGFTALLVSEGFVYAFGSEDQVNPHPIHLARWPVLEVAAGRLDNPEWWLAEKREWSSDASVKKEPIFEDGQSEFSVHLDKTTGRFLLFETRGFGAADVVMRSAESITGSWSDKIAVFRPAEYYRPHVLIYAAKAHPEQLGADVVLTYNTNSFEFREHLSDPEIYYPRFVRLSRCR